MCDLMHYRTAVSGRRPDQQNRRHQRLPSLPLSPYLTHTHTLLACGVPTLYVFLVEHRSDYNESGRNQVGSKHPDEPHTSGGVPGAVGGRRGPNWVIWGWWVVKKVEFW